MSTTAKLEIKTISDAGLSAECALIPVSKISTEDAFMKLAPNSTKAERDLHNRIGILEHMTKKGYVKDFYKPIMDPGVTNSYNWHEFLNPARIVYEEGNAPATGGCVDFWLEMTRFAGGWRIGNKHEYVGFLGILIKMLIEEENFSVAEAWNAVCNDSKDLGIYHKPYEDDMRNTGSKGICGFYDLGNTRKIIEINSYTSVYAYAGGDYTKRGQDYPLSRIEITSTIMNDFKFGHLNVVPWLVHD